MNKNLHITNYYRRMLPNYRFTQNYNVNGCRLYLVGERYDTYIWKFSKLVELLEKGILEQEEQK